MLLKQMTVFDADIGIVIALLILVHFSIGVDVEHHFPHEYVNNDGEREVEQLETQHWSEDALANLGRVVEQAVSGLTRRIAVAR